MNTDKQGNKLPQPVIKKPIKSANERARIAGTCNHCKCGYHIRSVNHTNGQHHKTWTAKQKKGVKTAIITG